jgi:hypothetical protein
VGGAPPAGRRRLTVGARVGRGSTTAAPAVGGGGGEAEGGGGARKTTGRGVVPRGEDREEREKEMDG